VPKLNMTLSDVTLPGAAKVATEIPSLRKC